MSSVFLFLFLFFPTSDYFHSSNRFELFWKSFQVKWQVSATTGVSTSNRCLVYHQQMQAVPITLINIRVPSGICQITPSGGSSLLISDTPAIEGSAEHNGRGGTEPTGKTSHPPGPYGITISRVLQQHFCCPQEWRGMASSDKLEITQPVSGSPPFQNRKHPEPEVSRGLSCKDRLTGKLAMLLALTNADRASDLHVYTFWTWILSRFLLMEFVSRLPDYRRLVGQALLEKFFVLRFQGVWSCLSDCYSGSLRTSHSWLPYNRSGLEPTVHWLCKAT
jgi:hypothetical protein